MGVGVQESLKDICQKTCMLKSSFWGLFEAETGGFQEERPIRKPEVPQRSELS